jgi:excinuclease ABC subunit C
VRSHFAVDGATSLKNREMLRRVADVDTIVVGSEAEALLLEANLIKEHRPASTSSCATTSATRTSR